MPAQTRRSGSRPSRAQRRANAQSARTYNVPAARTPNVPPARTGPYVPRRSFAPEPPPIDHTVEFGFVRKDLIRILLWSGLIIATMVVLSFIF